jgi:hypothetical protein
LGSVTAGNIDTKDALATKLTEHLCKERRSRQDSRFLALSKKKSFPVGFAYHVPTIVEGWCVFN